MKKSFRCITRILTFLFIFSLTACQQTDLGTYSQIESDITAPPQYLSSEPEESSEPSSETTSEILSEASSEVSSAVSSEAPSSNGNPAAYQIDGAVSESARVDSSYFDDAVFVGDSVSLKLEYYESAVDKLGKAQFLTAGSLGSGNATDEISETSVLPYYNDVQMHLTDSVPLTGAKKMYIMLGMNDLAVYGVDGTVQNYTALLSSLQAATPGLTIYVQSMTPLTSTSEILGEDLNNENVGIYNKKMMEVCNANGWYFIDVASVMYDSEGNLIRDFCSDPDNLGVHFTESGCEAWIEYLYTHVPN